MNGSVNGPTQQQQQRPTTQPTTNASSIADIFSSVLGFSVWPSTAANTPWSRPPTLGSSGPPPPPRFSPDPRRGPSSTRGQAPPRPLQPVSDWDSDYTEDWDPEEGMTNDDMQEEASRGASNFRQETPINTMRDNWLTPLLDWQSIVGAFDPDQERSEQNLTGEALANKEESQVALRYTARIVILPLVAGFLISRSLADPILHYSLQNNPVAFAMTDRQKVEGAQKVHVEMNRLRMDMAIGRAPPLNESQLHHHLEATVGAGSLWGPGHCGGRVTVGARSLWGVRVGAARKQAGHASRDTWQSGASTSNPTPPSMQLLHLVPLLSPPIPRAQRVAAAPPPGGGRSTGQLQFAGRLRPPLASFPVPHTTTSTLELRGNSTPASSPRRSVQEFAEEVLVEEREHNEQSLITVISDSVSLLVLLLLLTQQADGREALRNTTARLFDGLSNIAKAVAIILVADTLLGYHSEEGWTGFIELVLGHYGIEAEEPYVVIFVSIVPVTMDCLLKYWLFVAAAAAAVAHIPELYVDTHTGGVGEGVASERSQPAQQHSSPGDSEAAAADGHTAARAAVVQQAMSFTVRHETLAPDPGLNKTSPGAVVTIKAIDRH
ncbi:MAG: hypothetical protein WDW36_006600 [Sanguina aurantia]